MSIQQEKFKIIADKIREKTGTAESIKPNDFASKIDDVYEQGKTDEYNKMWDRLQRNGENTYYTNFFQGYCWGWDNFYPKYDIKIKGDGQRAFYVWNSYNSSGSLTARLNECGVKLDTSECTRMTYMFGYNMFTEIPDLDFTGFANESASYCNGVFVNGRETVKIGTITVKKELSYNGWFTDNRKLKEIRFEGKIAKSIGFPASPLDKESQISIITHLCTDEDVTGQTVTFKKSAVNNAFGIDIDDETTYPEGSEYYELRYSKPNWNFAYSA